MIWARSSPVLQKSISDKEDSCKAPKASMATLSSRLAMSIILGARSCRQEQ